MPRGTITRQPGKTGRHEGVQRAPLRGTSPLQKQQVSKQRATRVAKKTRTQDPSTPARSLGSLAVARDDGGKGRAAKVVGRGRPPKGYDPVAPERVRELLRRLDQTYPGATCALQHRNAWELLVATILSAQCTDVRVNMVTPELFRKYPRVQDFARLKPEELEPDIRSTGFFRNKAKSLVVAAQKIVKEYGGEVPDEMADLLKLPGVARKTANVVLGTWFKKNEGLVVDTHVQRIARRLELTTNTDPGKIEQDLMRVIPREKWTDFSHQIIWHGRRLCTARSPRCAECPLENLCHAADKTWSTVEMHAEAK